jgi:hypothetical protein
MLWFAYSSHKTLDRASDALEDYYATGEVSDGDQPRIVELRDHRRKLLGYAIEVRGN